jgi:outer membrane protein, adhesin transport system
VLYFIRVVLCLMFTQAFAGEVLSDYTRTIKSSSHTPFLESEPAVAWCQSALSEFRRSAAVADNSCQVYSTESDSATASLTQQLDALVKETVRSHPNVEARNGAVNEAGFGLRVAELQYYPAPSVQVSQRSDGTHVTSLQLTQPLWTWGRLTAGVDAANSQKQSAEFSVLEAQYGLALTVVSAYQTLQLSLGRQRASNNNLERLLSLESLVKRRIAQGASPLSDSYLISSRLNQSRSELANELANGNSALAQLSLLAGREVTATEIQLQSGVAASEFFNHENEEQFVQYALSNHPVLSRFSADIAVADAQQRAQKAALWPSLALQAQHTTTTAPGTIDNDSVFLTVQYQPGAGLSSFAQAEAAQARLQSVRALRAGAERSLVQAIRVEWQSGTASSKRLANALANAKTAAEVLESYKRLFKAGKRSWYDVVNVARDLLIAEQALAEVNAQLVVTRYKIDVLSGKFPWLGKERS